MEEKIKELLEEVRPSLQGHGGDLEYVGFEDGKVQIRLTGACQGCPMSTQTTKFGIERFLKEKLPEVTEVEEVS